MQQFWVLAATWLLSWIDWRTESGVAQVFCNCTCEVQLVHCEVNSWSFEALKACLWVLFGLTIGLGKLTLGILYWLWEQLLITLHSRTLSIPIHLLWVQHLPNRSGQYPEVSLEAHNLLLTGWVVLHTNLIVAELWNSWR